MLIGGIGNKIIRCRRFLKGRFKPSLERLRVRLELSVDRLYVLGPHFEPGISTALAVKDTPHFDFIKALGSASNIEWKNTEYWRLVERVLKEHRERCERPYRHNGREVITSADDMCSRFRKLYVSIRDRGNISPIKVTAGSDGRFYILDGLHRSAIASFLGRGTVPAVICAADEGLRDLMKSLRDVYPVPGAKCLYTPVDHPVFNDWKVLRNNRRWELIRRETDWQGKTVVDIGSYTGYFSHKAAAAGARVIGLELDASRIEQARAIDRLLGLNVPFILKDFREYLLSDRADIAMCFSVMHWILKQEGMRGFKEAISIISRACSLMFFDMGQDTERKMRRREWTHGLKIGQQTIPEMVCGNSSYRYWKWLGRGDTGRDVFVFSVNPVS